MSISERGPFDPLPFNEVSSAIAEFAHLDFTLAVDAIQIESDTKPRSFEWHF